MRALGGCALFVALASTLASRPAGQSPDPALYEVYVTRGHETLDAALDGRAAWTARRQPLLVDLDHWVRAARERALTGDETAPHRVLLQAAFAFEIGARALAYSPGDAMRFFAGARDLTAAAVGASPDPTDAMRFEATIHRAIVGTLHSLPNQTDVYLGSIRDRIALLHREGVAGARQLQLAGAIVAESRTIPFSRPPAPVTVNQVSSALAYRGDLTRALNAFDAVAGIGGVAAEANIRRGLLFHRLGRHREALAALDAGLSAGDDADIRYWGWLFKGRVLGALDRRMEAAAAYRKALELRPNSQTPALALAALLFLQGARQEAEVYADIARTMPTDRRELWWDYWYGDRRFLPQLIGDIRKWRR